jgi:hypothetical protein
MQSRLKFRLRLWSAFLCVIGLCFVAENRVGAASLPHPSCSTFCDSGRECFDECEVPVGESWLFTTCGEYDGANGYNGYCNPDSCVNSCNEFASCGYECSYGGEAMDCDTYGTCTFCGDGTCVQGAENRTNCPADCGYCGDGICQVPFETTSGTYCTADCGPLTGGPEPPECDPEEQDCGDDICIPNGSCQPISACNGPGLCFQDSDCCEENFHEKCYVFPNSLNGIGYCAYSGNPTSPKMSIGYPSR